MCNSVRVKLEQLIMKSLKALTYTLLLFLFILAGCQKENIEKAGDILPSGFKIDIPESLSDDGTYKTAPPDTLEGKDIYRHMRRFIYVGENASERVESILNTIRKYNLNREMSFSYTSKLDGRVKDAVVESNVEYDGRIWEFEMTISDAASESNDDKGIAMQIFWNRDPVEGIAVMKPEYLNINEKARWENAMVRIDYSQNPANTDGYDAIMIVSIAQLPATQTDRFSIKNMKMFVGQKGDRVDVAGNSDHPYAWLLVDTNPGLDWAFTASAYVSTNIGVASVGLPPNNLNNGSRDTLLGKYSIKNVLTVQYNQWFFNNYGRLPTPDELAAYLSNADSPGFFNRYGFVSAGTAPDSQYEPLEQAINSLTPYNPRLVANLRIEFKLAE